MTTLRAYTMRIGLGIPAIALLLSCDANAPVALQDEQTLARTMSIAPTLSEKEAAANGGSIGPLMLQMMSSAYTVAPIPYAPEAAPTANPGPSCDDCVMNDVPIGFSFQFYGNSYSTLQISSNGFVRFAPGNNDSGCCSGRPIPLNDLWNNIIAIAWTDLNPSPAGAGNIQYETRGSAPNRRFVLQFTGVTIWPNTDPRVTAQLILYEGSHVIELHTASLVPHTQNITQGIENLAGSDAHFIAGRVATTFALNNDGVRFTPLQAIDVDIHAVYSGTPNRPPGEIHLEDQYVFVEILDVEAYIPRPASPGDVRIGPTWEDGIPANAFTILDIDSDGNRDIRLRWVLADLQNAGLLPLGPVSLVVWGRDATDDELYRGVGNATVFAPAPPDVCFGNGGFVTHPGAGPGGADVSMADPVNDAAGSNVQLQPGGPHFRIADDFSVGAGGCVVAEVVTYGYQTGPPPTWTSANLNIRSGSVTGTIVASAVTTTWEWTGVYRTFNGILNNADRPIFRVRFTLPNVALAPGTYWIDWQIQGGSSGWAPFVTQPPVPPGGNNTTTVLGNGQQMTAGGVWQPTLTPPGAEVPFEILGVAGPAVASPSRPILRASTFHAPRNYNQMREDRPVR